MRYVRRVKISFIVIHYVSGLESLRKRERVFVSITGGKQFCLNLHVHLHVALVISHHRSYCLAEENPLLADNTLCF